jgi:hypothetical protein
VRGGSKLGSTERWVLVASLALGALLRVQGLTRRELWIDEYGTWWTIAGASFSDCFRRALEIQGQSPLYYLITRLSVDLLGVGEASLRLPSLVSGLALLAVAFPLARCIFRDGRAAVLCVAAFALSEQLIYSSQEARPYALALLLGAGSFYGYAALLERDGLWRRSAYVLVTAAAYYAQYLFGVIVLAQAVHLLARRPWSWTRLRPWVASWALLGLAMLPGLWQLRALFGRRGSLDWIPTSEGVLASLEPALELLDPVVLAVAAGASLLAWAWRRERWSFPSDARPAIALVWLALPVLVFGLIPPLVGVSLASARYLVVMAPAVALIQGFVLSLPGRAGALAWLPLIVFAGFVASARIVPFLDDSGRFWWYAQHGWKGATHELMSEHRPGDLVLYRTGFVELDDLVRGRASAATTEFVRWPLAAHLPRERDYRLQPLPYSDTPEMRRAIAAILEEARARRIWIVGLELEGEGAMLASVVRTAQVRHHMRLVRDRRHGLVHVALLVRGVPGSTGP